MEAVDYFKEKKRMTKGCDIGCDKCQLGYRGNGRNLTYQHCAGKECTAVDIVPLNSQPIVSRVGTNRRNTEMTKIIIALLVTVFIIDAVVVYACCVAAGDADEAMERMRREECNDGSADQSAGRDHS